jgi:hypothetical protein
MLGRKTAVLALTGALVASGVAYAYLLPGAIWIGGGSGTARWIWGSSKQSTWRANNFPIEFVKVVNATTLAEATYYPPDITINGDASDFGLDFTVANIITTGQNYHITIRYTGPGSPTFTYEDTWTNQLARTGPPP